MLGSKYMYAAAVAWGHGICMKRLFECSGFKVKGVGVLTECPLSLLLLWCGTAVSVRNILSIPPVANTEPVRTAVTDNRELSRSLDKTEPCSGYAPRLSSFLQVHITLPSDVHRSRCGLLVSLSVDARNQPNRQSFA